MISTTLIRVLHGSRTKLSRNKINGNGRAYHQSTASPFLSMVMSKTVHSIKEHVAGYCTSFLEVDSLWFLVIFKCSVTVSDIPNSFEDVAFPGKKFHCSLTVY